MRIMTISDIHVDYKVNMAWALGISTQDYQEDILILAGDISEDVSKIKTIFKHLKSCFKMVLFVPGNHDLWVKSTDPENSMDKFLAIMALAEAEGVLTKPLELPQVSIVPLLSWYDFSFGECSQYLQDRWMDFYRCRWEGPHKELPQFSLKERSVTDFFLELNQPHLLTHHHKVISFSHFMPRLEIMPEHMPLIHKKLFPVLGASRIDDQLREIGSSLHIYGHSHLNRNITLEGVTYINNAYGNPGEEMIARKQLKCVWEI